MQRRESMNNIAIGELAAVARNVNMKQIASVVARADALGIYFPGVYLEKAADIAAVVGQYGIDVGKWLIADDLDFAREYWSIGHYLNRKTGKLEGYAPSFVRIT